MNQPQAGLMNLRSLTQALAPLLDEDDSDAWDRVQAMYSQASEAATAEVWRQKLGLRSWSPAAANLFDDVLRLMRNHRVDWTITWRQLAACLEVSSDSDDNT